MSEQARRYSLTSARPDHTSTVHFATPGNLYGRGGNAKKTDETRKDEGTLTERNHKIREWAVVLKGFFANFDPRNMFKGSKP